MVELWAAVVTAVGVLAGSFGGYLLAARAQRSADERKDARDREAVETGRALQLEDERHDFQLRTLMALQDLVRRIARNTIEVIEHDRRTIEQHSTYHLLSGALDADGMGRASSSH